jgi:small subunit ribosomal protein S2
VLFVGTKKQARDAVKEIAEASGMPYVNQRWLGGLLTNFQTISQRIRRLHDLERYEREGQLALLPTRERLSAEADLTKLRANLGGVKDMQRPPDAMFVVDLKTEAIAVREAQRLRIPIIGLVDTNCDPDGIEYVIPGNDDAIRACALITQGIGSVVSEGRQVFRAEEEKARAEAEEKARREAEERARREAEETARREAEEAARREAEEAARQEALVAGGEGQPRQQAEATVAAAATSGRRPQPDPRVPQKADKPEAAHSRKKAGVETDKTPAPPAEDGQPITNADLQEDRAAAAAPAAPAAAEAPAAPAAEAAAPAPAEAPVAEAAAPAPEPEAPAPAAEAAPEAPAPAAEPEAAPAAEAPTNGAPPAAEAAPATETDNQEAKQQ